MSSIMLRERLFQDIPCLVFNYSEPIGTSLVEQVAGIVGVTFELPSLPEATRAFATVGMWPCLWISWDITFSRNVRSWALGRYLDELQAPEGGFDYRFSTGYLNRQAMDAFLGAWKARVVERAGRAIRSAETGFGVEYHQSCTQGERLARLCVGTRPLTKGRWLDQHGTLHE